MALPTYPPPSPYGQPYSNPQYQQLPNNARDSFSVERAHTWPELRISGGAGSHYLTTSEIDPSFLLDVTAGYRWGVHKRLFLTFEGGYSFDSDPLAGGHFGTIGAGPEVFINWYLGVGWSPKFVIGEAGRGLGFGVRNTLTVPIFYRILNIELGHQYLLVDDRFEQHELRAQAGVDLGAAVYYYLWRRHRGMR